MASDSVKDNLQMFLHVSKGILLYSCSKWTYFILNSLQSHRKVRKGNGQMKEQHLKTFRELAEILEVTRQTIYNIANELTESVTEEELKQYIVLQNNVKHLTADGQDYIRNKLGVKSQNAENLDVINLIRSDLETKSQYIQVLEDQLTSKDEELKAKNEIIATLTRQLDKSSDIISTYAKVEEMQKAIEGMKLQQLEQPKEEKEDRPGFFRRLFNK